MALVEHENNAVVVHAFSGREVTEVARTKVAYHPDFARWIADDLVIAAVEGSSGVEVFRLEAGRLIRLTHVMVGFSPRDVVLVSRTPEKTVVVATPYSGAEVAWVELPADLTQSAKVTMQNWCPWPWHPRKGLPHASVGGGELLLVGCLDSHQLLSVSVNDRTPKVIRKFDQAPRMAVVSPSGRWWYVALELGGKNARIDSQTGELQWLSAPSWGAVSIAPISDDLVAWGDDRRVFIQRYASDGVVLETRELPVTGFPTELQLLDVDQDGLADLNVYNSAGSHVDVIFGPLWEQASPVGQASSYRHQSK